MDDFKAKASQYKPHTQTQHSDKLHHKPPSPRMAKGPGSAGGSFKQQHHFGSAGSGGGSFKAVNGVPPPKPAAGRAPAVHVQTDAGAAAGNGAHAAAEHVAAASS